MINAQFVSIETWPGEKRASHSRSRSKFRAKYAHRLDLLERELFHLHARDILVQAYFSRSDIRNDGWPRSSARPTEPGIIVSFRNSKGEDFAFPCDRYDAWEDNLYAVALSLEALRAVDRHGVTRRAEQYQGWKRLQSPEQEQVRDKEWAMAHLARVSGTVPAALRGDPAAVELAYRTAAKRTHPDAGGSAEAFQVVQEAINILRPRPMGTQP